MCGICGFIGESKDPKITYDLISGIFARAEERGTDAAGFWGAQAKANKVIYHKEPIRSSALVESQIWQSTKDLNLDILLAHARGASAGVGVPSINKNNHPFVSEDYSTALIHNGRIIDNDYSYLIKKYEVASSCDSEILLRIFEKEVTNETFEARLQGLKELWTLAYFSQMAVGIGECGDNLRRLWLFRNRARSLWIVDLREILGQIFFSSTPAMWHNALSTSSWRKIFHKKRVKLIEVPPQEVWMFQTENGEITDIQKHRVALSNNFREFGDNEYFKIQKKERKLEVITSLNENEELDIFNYRKDKEEYNTVMEEAFSDQDRYLEQFNEIPVIINRLKVIAGDISNFSYAYYRTKQNDENYNSFIIKLENLEKTLLDIKSKIRLGDVNLNKFN